MQIFIADVETSGLKHSCSMHSCAYLILDADTMQRVDSGVLYFCPEDMHWTVDAYDVHGLTVDFLEKYRDDFEMNTKKLFQVVTRANFVGYNSNFDKGFISRHLQKYGYGSLTLNSETDMMRVFQPYVGGKRKLAKLLEELNIQKTMIDSMAKLWFPDTKDHEGGYHTASYDVAATGLLYIKARSLNLL